MKRISITLAAASAIAVAIPWGQSLATTTARATTFSRERVAVTAKLREAPRPELTRSPLLGPAARLLLAGRASGLQRMLGSSGIKSMSALSGFAAPSIPGVRGLLAPDGSPHKALAAAAGWRAMEAPRPKLAPDPGVQLTGVACPSRGGCVAIGTYVDSDGNSQGMILTQSAGKWLTRKAPLPKGASVPGYVVMYALTCPGPGVCIAVGDYTDVDKPGLSQNSQDTAGLIEMDHHGIWTAIKAPTPVNSDYYANASIYSIACPSATWCVAVGSYNVSSQTEPEILTLSMGKWSSIEAPSPGSQSGASFGDVACGSVGHCVAVGYSGINDEEPLLAQLSGSKWTYVAFNASPQGGDLDDVACPASTTCIAVGSMEKNKRLVGLAAVRVGRSWKLTSTPLASNIPSSQQLALVDLSMWCDTRECVAVGAYLTGDVGETSVRLTALPLLRVYRQGSWTAPKVPVPGNADVSMGELDSVVCRLSGTCVAVGPFQTAGSEPQGVMVSGSGATWSASATARPKGAVATTLTAVACPKAGACQATGYYIDQAGNTQGYTVSGPSPTSRASRAHFPRGAGQQQSFTISQAECPASGTCVVLGTNLGRSIIADTLRAGRWNVHKIPNPAGIAPIAAINVDGLSCPATRSCVAVADYLNDLGVPQGEILILAHGRWTETPIPAPKGQVVIFLGLQPEAVTCASSGHCMVVGYYGVVGGQDRAFISTEAKGGGWTTVTAPVPTGSGKPTDDALLQGSCSMAVCAAVGGFIDTRGDTQPLIVSGSGNRWSSLRPPVPKNGTGFSHPAAILGYSACVLKTCTAVGEYIDKNGAQDGLIVSGTGSKWIASAVQPGGSSPEVTLASISCVSSARCTIVGDYIDPNSGNVLGLIVSGSGAAWKMLRLNRAPAASILQEIDCSSVTACGATGAYPDDAGDILGLLATSSGGSWTTGSAPLPANAGPLDGEELVQLGPVSCKAPACLAAGSYTDAHGVLQGLIEQHG